MKEYIRAKQIYNMEKEYEERIAIFETSPMDDSDLGIWHQYLDFAEKEGDHEKVVGLYERCLTRALPMLIFGCTMLSFWRMRT